MPRKNSNKLLKDGSVNPDYVRSGGKSGVSKARRKVLPDGSINPNYILRKPRRKVLPDGGINPNYVARKGGKHRPAFLTGEFVGVDGEGEDLDGNHLYTYLAHNNESIYDKNGLSSEACFEFLLKMGSDNPKGIFCIFAGGYDGNLWLRDVPKQVILCIVEADGQYPIYWEGYGIKFVQRRFFEIRRRIPKLNERGKPEKPVKVWDVWGFFQGSFISAIKQWMPGYDKLDLIIEGKLRRVDFHGSDYEFMVAYNAAELEALVLMMNKLRDVMIEMGLTLRGWHGAGAVASAIYKNNDVKRHLEKPPEPVYQASKHAYFGGRIELGQFGTHMKTIHHYDVNSSYPAKQRNLPSLAGGEWIQRGKGFDTRTTANICIALVRWGGMDESIFCPFPYRSAELHMVLYPAQGLNWVYKPELDAALKWADKTPCWVIDVEDSYEFIPATNELPFDFINDDYKTRQAIVTESKRSGVPNGKEKGIKLGLNSLYGKTAQRIGYSPKIGRLPPFHNLLYAGYITSAARAELFDAAMQAPDKIICMATDGIYSTVPLDLDCPTDKVLGKWEYQTHEGMVLVQSGFYFLFDKNDGLQSYSRGFDKMVKRVDILNTLAIIQAAWKKKQSAVYLPCTRFITLKSALCGGDWWDRWLSWYKFKTVDKKTGQEFDGRRLTITPIFTKRHPLNGKPHLEMVQTVPGMNFCPHMLSAAHDIPWDINPDINTTEPSESVVGLEHFIDSAE